MLKTLLSLFTGKASTKPSAPQAQTPPLAPSTGNPTPASPRQDEAPPEAWQQRVLLGDEAKSDELQSGERDLLAEVELQIQDIDYIAHQVLRCPVMLDEIDREVRKPDYSPAALAECIGQSPQLSTRLIQMVNSPAYNASGKAISSLQQAVTVLGAETIRKLTTQLLFEDMTHLPKVYFKRFGENLWRHTLLSAKEAEMLAKEQDEDKDLAFLTGLVQPIGKIAIFHVLVNFLRRSPEVSVPSTSLFQTALDTYGPELSAKLVRAWQLPDPVCDAVEALSHEHTTDSIPAQLIRHARHRAELKMAVEQGVMSQGQADALGDTTGT